MYNIIKLVIDSKDYELTDILKKIDTIWIQGEITDDERTELKELARQNAIPENSYASLQAQIDSIYVRLDALEAKVTGGEGETSPDEYKPYVQPTGAHDAYHKGDKITFNGKKYICDAPEDVAVVWSPDVYPSYWKEEV